MAYLTRAPAVCSDVVVISSFDFCGKLRKRSSRIIGENGEYPSLVIVVIIIIIIIIIMEVTLF